MSLRKLELLAPAGQMEALHRVVEAGADAVYLGGKRFNMRALNSDLNFSEEEIAEAVQFTHQKHRKLYITVNNLYNGQEIDDIADYLLYLDQLEVDALIVQDLGIIELCQKLQLGIPLHASVQMGIANLEAVRVLEASGFQRVILSKNVSLPEIEAIAEETKLGIEYFVHGDLCISHAGQCFMSSFIAGQSGNRGRCLKPCRWAYELEGAQGEGLTGFKYCLAHKDLCLYPYLAQLVTAGVSSFKIEGRMRTADYLAYLVGIYRSALDRLTAEPETYQTDPVAMLDLQEHRIRDYTAGNLFEPMGRNGIGFDGQREPLFRTAVQPLQRLHLHESKPTAEVSIQSIPELSVRAGGLNGLQSIAELKIDNLILGCDQFWQNQQNWNRADLLRAAEIFTGTGTKIFLETPRIVSQKDLEALQPILSLVDCQKIHGVIVNDLGSLRLFQDAGREMWAGYGLNTFNPKAADFLKGLGINRITASLEMGAADLRMLLTAGTPTEVVVQGPLPGMVTDYCIIRAAQSEADEDCARYCLHDEYALEDSCGQRYRIVTDQKCRNYLYFPYELCLLAYLPELSRQGAKSFRIESQFYEPEQLRQVVGIYHSALEQLAKGQWEPADNFKKIQDLFPRGLTAAAFIHSDK
jgi:U32 family peptidase